MLLLFGKLLLPLLTLTRKRHDLCFQLVQVLLGRLVELTTPAGRTWRLGYAGAQVTKSDGPAGSVRRDRDAAGRTRRLRAAGVDGFQIDSVYQSYAGLPEPPGDSAR